MNRFTKLLIAVFAIWSILLSTACSGPQNTNVAVNQPPRQDNNANTTVTPTPGANPSSPACDPNGPGDRAAAVQAAIDDKVSHDSDLNTQKMNHKFKYIVVTFPKANPTDPDSQALALVIGGVISGKNVFQRMIPIVQPVMGQRCVQAVVLVPYAKVPTIVNITSLDDLAGDGLIWSGCDYPAVACPDGSCATSCPGSIGKTSETSAADSTAKPATANNNNTASTNKP